MVLHGVARVNPKRWSLPGLGSSADDQNVQELPPKHTWSGENFREKVPKSQIAMDCTLPGTATRVNGEHDLTEGTGTCESASLAMPQVCKATPHSLS